MIDTNHVQIILNIKVHIFWEGYKILLSYVVPVKSKEKISENFVAFSEYMNFKQIHHITAYLFNFLLYEKSNFF